MNIEEIKIVLANKKGAFPVTLITETIPDLKGGKKCPILVAGTITKSTHINGIVNFLYESSVNRQRGREDLEMNFESEPRKWGCRLHIQGKLLPFVHHKKGIVQPSHRDIQKLTNLPHADELYLEMKCQNVYNVQYYQLGKQIDTSVVEPYLRDRTEGERQGVENVVVLRDYKLSNIKQITVDGKLYEIR